ncbi:hypothetical protein E4T56_gene14823, partial [Termitomyces sp. T112]
AAIDPAMAERQRQEAQLRADAPLRGENRTGQAQDGTMGLGLFDAADQPTFRLDAEGPEMTLPDLLKMLDDEQADIDAMRSCMAEGRIKTGMAQEAERLYHLHYNQLKHSMGMMAAASEASERAIRALEARQQQKMRQALLQAKAQKGWLERRMGEVESGRPFN